MLKKVKGWGILTVFTISGLIIGGIVIMAVAVCGEIDFQKTELAQEIDCSNYAYVKAMMGLEPRIKPVVLKFFGNDNKITIKELEAMRKIFNKYEEESKERRLKKIRGETLKRAREKEKN